MQDQFSRTRMLLGDAAMERLARARVAVFGVGGVGGCAAEALARSGVGALDLIDDDRVSVSNLNRQMIALHSTVGQYKVDAAKARLLDIAPGAMIRVYRTFYLPQTADQFDFTAYDYIVDAIDTVTGKLSLAVQAQAAGTPIISSMGAGNKLDPSALQVADIYSTSVCPLARVMRKELKKRGVRALKVVYSQEKPMVPLPEQNTLPEPDILTELDAPLEQDPHSACRRQVPASSSFVPPAAGLLIAAEIVKDLTGIRGNADRD